MAEETKQPIRVFSETFAKFQPLRQAMNAYSFQVPGGTWPEELLEPAAWKHTARLFEKDWKNAKICDIHVFCGNRIWRQVIEMRVWAPQHLTVLPVTEVCWYGLGDPRQHGQQEVMDEDVAIASGIPVKADKGDFKIFCVNGGHRVRRKADGVDLVIELENYQVAEAWLESYLEKLAA